jgi:hypothetical protein
MIDIKFPIGLMFSILGLLLTIYGIFTMSDPLLYKKAFDININLWSGCGMMVFGGFMLITSKITKKAKEK